MNNSTNNGACEWSRGSGTSSVVGFAVLFTGIAEFVRGES